MQLDRSTGSTRPCRLFALPHAVVCINAVEAGVDWYWDRILVGAALSTVLGVGAELAAADRSGSDGKVIVALRQGAQDMVN